MPAPWDVCMTIDWYLAATIALVLLGSGLLQGLTGFGFGMSCMAVLPFLVADMKLAVPVASMVGLVVLPPLAFELYRYMNWRAIVRFGVGIAVGTVIGTLCLVGLDQHITLGVLAVAIIFVSIRGLCRANREAPAMDLQRVPSWPLASVLGILSGFFGAYVNTAGAPLAIYAYSILPALGARALLTALFSLAGLFKIFTYAHQGLWTAPVLVYGGLASPMAILGVRLGAKLHYRLGHAGTVKVAWGALLVLGLVHGLRASGVIPARQAQPADRPEAAANLVDLPRGGGKLGDTRFPWRCVTIRPAMRICDGCGDGDIQANSSASPTDS